MISIRATLLLALIVVFFVSPTVGHGEVLSNIAAVSGAYLSYEIQGTGPPLALINDGVLDRRMWDDQVTAFAAHYTVIRYDFRGWGKSELPQQPFSYVDDLYHLLKFLHAEKAVLLGSFVGGGVALDFACEHPEMVDRVVAVTPFVYGFPYSPSTKVWTQAWYATAQSGKVSQLIDMYMNDPMLGRRLKDNAAARERIEAMLSENFSVYSVDFGRLLLGLDPPTMQVLPAIRTPTLILTGDAVNHDFLDITEMLQRGIRDSTRMVIPHAGTLVNIEKPEEFNRIVLDWLSQQPVRGEKAMTRT